MRSSRWPRWPHATRRAGALVRLACTGTAVVLFVGSSWAENAKTTAQDSSPDAARGNVVGIVHDEAGNAVADATIEVLDGNGQVVNRTTSSRAGGYQIPCVAPGEYDLRLDAQKSGHRGERVVAPVTADGLTVDWTVARDKPAIARARPSGGSCAPAPEAAGAPAGAAGGEAAALGLGAGAAAVSGTIGGFAASGAFDSNGTATPSQ
jgi:hypothetical protein